MSAPPAPAVRPQLLFFGDVAGEATAGGERMAVLRFEPVRITQIRIIPLGVRAFKGASEEVGQTAPSAFELDVYFHTLPPPRTPATVLPYHLAYDASTSARRASQAFEPKLPADTRGRLLIITGRYERLTLAIYGQRMPVVSTPEPIAPAPMPQPTVEPIPTRPTQPVPTLMSLPAQPIPSFVSPPLPARPAPVASAGPSQRMAPSVSRERVEVPLPPLPDVYAIVQRQRKRPRLMVPDPTVDDGLELAIGVLSEGRGRRAEVARIVAECLASPTVAPTRSLSDIESSVSSAFALGAGFVDWAELERALVDLGALAQTNDISSIACQDEVLALLGSAALSDARRSRLCAALLAIGKSIHGLRWLQMTTDERNGMDHDGQGSIVDTLASCASTCAEARRLRARITLVNRLESLERLASATTVDAAQLTAELDSVTQALRSMTGDDAEVAARLMHELGMLSVLEALAESARDEGQSVDAIAAVLLALCLRPAGLALVVRTLIFEDCLARWQALLDGAEVVAASRLDDAELYAALSGAESVSASVVASALTALVSVAAALVALAGGVGDADVQARGTELLSLWTALPLPRMLIRRVIVHPSIFRDLLDEQTSDDRRRLLDTLLDDVSRLGEDETVAAIEAALASDRRGLVSKRWQHISAILQPSIPRLAAIGRLAETMASVPGGQRSMLVWRMRGHLARLRVGRDASAEAENWSAVQASLYRTRDGEFARVLGLVLDAVEPIVGTAAWSSHASSDTTQSLAQPSAARETLVELLRAAGDLIDELGRSDFVGRGGENEMAENAARCLAVGRAALAVRTWLAATVAADRPFRHDVEVAAASSAALSAARRYIARADRRAVLEATFERVAPERLTSGAELVDLVLATLPDPSGSVDIVSAAHDLVTLVPGLARFLTLLPPSSADRLRQRIRAMEDIAELGLAKLVDDSVAGHSAPPTATATGRVDLAELVALIQPIEASDDVAKAPILVKTYQGDEFRAARIRPVAATSNPRLPSIHLDSWTGAAPQPMRRSASRG